MPMVLIFQGYRFSFFAADCKERMHLNIRKDDKYVKIWLDTVEIHKNYGFTNQEINFIESTILENLNYILEKWEEFCYEV
jgi:hypothetical protein